MRRTTRTDSLATPALPRSRCARGLAAGLLGLAAACGDPKVEPPALVPTTITISPGVLYFDALFATAVLTATVHDQYGHIMSGAPVSWASSSYDVARVDQTGRVTAVENGEAHIVATSGDASDSARADVRQRVHSVRIPPPRRRILTALEDTTRVTAAVLDPNGRPIAGAEVEWSSGDEGVATVDEDGLVTAVATGTAFIRASLEAFADSVIADVRQVPARVQIVPPDTLLAFGTLGDTLRLSATVVDSNGHTIPGLSVSWSTSDHAVAAIDREGLVTATGNGAATITATAHSASGSVRVEVDQIPASIAIESPTELIPVDDSVLMTAEAVDSGGSPIVDADFAWTSSDPAVAETTPESWVRAVGVGTVEITVTLHHLDASAPLTTMNRDEFALRAFFLAAHGELWTANGGWATDAPLSEWHGVELNERGRVRALVLSENNVAGWITPEIGKLDELENLHLESNLLEGPLPPEVGHLESLVWLGLFDNYLDGPLPPELGMIETLEVLDLSYNGFDGSIPREVVDLPRLWYLGLYGNKLSGSIPRYIGESPSLRFLNLCRNRFTGTIPGEIGRITTLESLKLCGRDQDAEASNRLTGAIPPQLGDLANLRVLDLGANRLEGPIPPELGSLEKLDSLWLYSNLLTSIPPEFGKLANLRYLSLYGNRLTGPIPSEIGNLANLQKLLLGRGLHSGDNSLDGSIPPELGNLANLYKLDLGGNDLTGGIPGELGMLKTLEYLELGTNELTGAIPPELGGASRLTWLALCPNNLSGPIPGEIGNLRAMRRLYICSNDMTGTLPPGIGRLTRLQVLHMGDNLLTGEFPNSMLNLTDLDFLIWHIRNEGLCAPDTEAFHKWLDGIRVHSGIICDDEADGATGAGTRIPRAMNCSVTETAAGPATGVAGRKGRWTARGIARTAETRVVACDRPGSGG